MSNTVEQIDVESRPVKWLIDGLKDGNIIIDNSFQRRYVWLSKDQIALIETILLGYPIPEIYLWQSYTDPDTGNTKYLIVDGQQRLGAVQSFLNDLFRLNKGSLDFPDSPYAALKFSQLDPELKSIIWKYKFSVRFIKESVGKEEISNLFLRLNRTNTTLNPQELRNAEFNGEFIKLADKISSLPIWNKYKLFNKGDLRRMQDIQFISTLLIFIRMGIEEETTQSAVNKAYDQYNESYPEADADYQIVEDVLMILESILSQSAYTADIAKKKTHLYTLFVFSYYLYRSQGLDLREVSEKLDSWYEKYSTESTFDVENYDLLLTEYRILSQEGVQKRPNRQRRFEILKEYCLA